MKMEMLFSKNKLVVDAQLRNAENVLLTDYIDVYFASEVLIHGPDVWIGKKGSDLIQNPDDKIFMSTKI